MILWEIKTGLEIDKNGERARDESVKEVNYQILRGGVEVWRRRAQ